MTLVVNKSVTINDSRAERGFSEGSMRILRTLLCILGLAAIASPAMAWHLSGYVHCDGNKNGVLDGQDITLPGVVVRVQNLGGTFESSGTSGPDGYYTASLLDTPDCYTANIDVNSIPAGASVIVPPGGVLNFCTDDAHSSVAADWLVRSDTCAPGQCWMTGGGTKFDTITNTFVAEKGTKTTFGGNVHPGCSATAGSGGDWNNVDRQRKLHFHGTDIPTVRCGNVEGIPPGSTSPKTPFNYIEYEGTGWVKGIQGNKANYPLVYFYAKVEDRNEPGSRGAKAGSLIDKYFLRVFTNPGDPIGSTIILVDSDGLTGTDWDTGTVSTGNLQIHVSSCDDPPLQ